MADIVKYKKINTNENGIVSDSDDVQSSGESSVQLAIEYHTSSVNKLKYEKNARLARCFKYSLPAVLLGLLVFVVAISISFIITRLVKEPARPRYNAAVASDVPVCSEIAGKILEQGGSAVDATITAMLCVGVVNPESSGIAGGGFMVIYDSKSQSSIAIDFRETAPALASTDMYNGSETLATVGGLSVGVPGELAGMKKAHDMYGRLPWKRLFEPVANLSRNGFKMTKHNERAARLKQHNITAGRDLFNSWYRNEDGSLKKEGDIIKRVEYAKALSLIGENGIEEFYNGTIADEIIELVQNNGGILSYEDLLFYEPRVLDAVSINISDMKVLTTPLPSGGPQLMLVLNLLDLIAKDGRIEDTVQAQQHLVESFKYSFSLRSDLGDPYCDECDKETLLSIQNNKLLSRKYAEFINKSISDYKTFNISHYNSSYIQSDHGTTHVSTLGADGLAVASTTSVNTYFGSKLITPETGIVINNDMDDFSSPGVVNSYGLDPSEANFIKPGKRAQSSICPVIVLKNGEDGKPFVKLVSGGAGGTHIHTANAQAVMRALYFDQDPKDAVDSRRLHHQLIPNVLFYEDEYPEDVLEYMRSIGHVTQIDANFAVIQQIKSTDDNRNISAHSDIRKLGRSFVTNIQP